VHGKPLTEKQRKFFGAIAGGAEPYKAQIGTMLTALPSNMMDRLSDALGFPQKAVTKLVTGKYQTPSEAMNIQSPAGAIAADVLLDPLTFIGGGAGASKAAKAVRAAGKTTSKAAKKVATKMDRAIYPTRTYRIEAPKGNQLSYKPSELAKKVQKKGDWTTSNLEDLAHYAQHRGLLEGKDVMLTEYKVPFWKKNIKADKDVVALKESQGTSRMEMNPNEFIVPRNNFLYPRRTTTIKGVPEHLLEDPLYNKYSMPMSYRASNYSSQPIKYIEDQLNAVTGHRMPLSTTISELRNQQPVRMETWKQPQFAPTEGVGKFKRFEEGGWLDKYNDMPQAQNGIEGTMGGLTDIGFNYNGAWNGPSMQMGGSLPGAVGFMYARTQSPAPSNGPYAKKTKASAQNGMEMSYYQHGLDFKPKTISQDGSRTPIYVSDPKDPRLKAYQDSLSAYNDMRKYFDMSRGYPRHKNEIKGWDVPVFHTVSDEINYYRKHPQHGWAYFDVNDFIQRTFGATENVLPEKLVNWVPRKGVELARKDLEAYNQLGLRIPVYKKPVQPVVLEEELRFEKPIPIPRDTRDLGYILPKPGQPTFPELYKYSPDTPTKFSFTSPTGKYNEQKTMYFPTKSALKSFVGGVRGATYQEGKDYASATGTLQDGGDITVDPMGYWNPDNVGNPVIIPSNVITMEGVDQPLIGISDTGDVQYMEPGEDYEFDGEYVTEYPVAKGGVSVNNTDAQPLKKLDQLLNFTNYNKPTKGGWLDKYN
jgi:hypothetical protein